MLDSLIIHIPVQDEFCVKTGNLYNMVGGDISYYQISTEVAMWRNPETLEVVTGVAKHPFEKVPSSYSNMAIKFYSDNVANTKPYIALNASTKILQGHNIFGGESVENLACEMIAMLRDYYPIFYNFLDISEARISRVDSTYSVRVDHERLIQPLLRFMSNVSNGHRKNDKKKRDFYNTIYFGGRTSRYGGCKIYGKHHEVMESIKELEKRSKQGNLQATKHLQVYTSEILEFSKCLVRLESSTKSQKLDRLRLPTNLWEFIRYQKSKKGRDVLTYLWRLWFDPILDSLKGEIMEDYDDSDIHARCKEVLWTQNISKKIKPKLLHYYSNCDCCINYAYAGLPFSSDTKFYILGKISYVKANNAFNFYQLVKANGFDDVKTRYSTRAFQINVKSLVDEVKISRAVLQNLGEDKGESVSVVKLLNLDFSSQFPEGYEPPISSHILDFSKYVNEVKTNRKPLRLVS